MTMHPNSAILSRSLLGLLLVGFASGFSTGCSGRNNFSSLSRTQQRESSYYYVATRTTTSSSCSAPRLPHTLLSSINNKADGGNNDMSDIFKSLNNRREQLQNDQERKRDAILSASCTSSIAAVLPDWVRRLDVDYPLVACGSSSGNVYLAHLETGNVVGVGKHPHRSTATNAADPQQSTLIAPERLRRVIRQLFGQYDGGGTLAIAVEGSIVCEATRSGSVEVWRLDRPDAGLDNMEGRIRMMHQGSVPSLQDCLVTSLVISNGLLFVGTDRGRVEAHALSSLPLSSSSTPELSWEVGNGNNSIVLDMDVHFESGFVVVATDSGSVDLLSLDDDDDDEESSVVLASFVPPFDRVERKQSNVFPTAVAIIETRTNAAASQASYTIACASNDGSVVLQPITMNDETQEAVLNQPLHELKPRHAGSVQCMTSPAPGILVTGAHDGTIRVWNAHERELQYQFVGYKVWLGSIWSDGIRIVSDGADNTIIAHVFAETKDGKKEKLDDEGAQR